MSQNAGKLPKNYEARMNANGTKSRELSAKMRRALYLTPRICSTAVDGPFNIIKNVCRVSAVLYLYTLVVFKWAAVPLPILRSC